MLDVYDDEEKRQRMLEELLQGGTTGPDVVQLPEMTITADRQQLQPQTGALAARDETSPTRAHDQTPPEPDATPSSPIPQADNPADRAVADFEKRVAEAKVQRARQSSDVAALEAGPSRSTNHTAGDIDTVLAMLLDLGANKGRGLGQITGAYASNREADDREQRQHEERMALAQARHKASQDPLEELIRTQNAEMGIRNEFDREQQLKGVGERAQQAHEDKLKGSDVYNSKVSLVGDQTAARVGTKVAKESELAPQINENARGKSAATAEGSTEATTNELRGNPRAVTEEEKIRNDLAAAQLEESKRGRAVTEANTAETRRRGDADSFRNQTKDMLVALQKARDLQKQIDAAPGHVPGLDNLQYNEPNLMLDQQAIHNQEILQQLINPETKRYFGTAVSANEDTARARAYGTGRLSGEDAREEAIKTIREGLESGVRGATIGHEDVAAQILKEYGLDDLLGTPKVTAVVEDAPASARDALPKIKPLMSDEELRKKYGAYGVKF